MLLFLWQKQMNKDAIKWMCLGLIVVLSGCYSPKRDLSVDPYNTPLIHLLDAGFDSGSGKAMIKWEYLGENPVENFVLQRRDATVFMNIERSSGAEANGSYATVGTFLDGDLAAGERLQYRVIAEHTEGGSVRTPAIEVPVPGAGLREIRRDPIGLAVQIIWGSEGDGVSGYELVRTPSGRAPETVFATDDPQQTSFWDRSIGDNLPHAYAIRSRLSNGVQLTSRSVSVQFYREGGRHLVETLRSSGERMRLSSGDLNGTGDLLAVIGRANQMSLARLRHTVNVGLDGVPRVSRRLIGVSFPQLTEIVPMSFDLAGPPLTGVRVVFPRAYIGGLDTFGRVKVIGINLVQNSIAWQLPDNWVSQSTTVRLAYDDQQRVFVATGGELRVYSPLGLSLGAVALPGDVPVDLAVQNNVVWAVWSDRVSRGMLQFVGEVLSDIVWDDVVTDLVPRGVTLNGAGQVFVLDSNRMRIFQPDGTPIMSWVLPSGSFGDGDLSVGGSAGSLVHLSSENGEVITYVP